MHYSGELIFPELILCCDVFNVAAEEPMELDEEDLIEIAEEADLIQAERIIDDNTDPRGGRDGRRKEDMEEALRKMEEHMLAMNLDEAEIQAEQSEDGWQVRLKKENCLSRV